MKRQNRRALGFVMILLAMTTVASAQSLREVSHSEIGASSQKTLPAAVPLLPRDNLGRNLHWLGGTAAPSIGLPAQGDSPSTSATGAGSPGTSNASQAKRLLETPDERHPEAAAPAGRGSRTKYWTVQGLMFASFVVAVETTHGCIKNNSCTAIPTQFQSRGAMYTVGLPLTTGLAYMSYLMKKHQNRWWYIPPLLLTAGDTVVSVHSARASR